MTWDAWVPSSWSAETALRFARREANSLGCKLVIGNPVELDGLGA